MLKQVTLDRANRLKDRSVSLTFITSLDQTSIEFMEIDELINTSGVIYFKSDGGLTQKEIDAIDSSKIEVEGKSKSARLRNVLYVYWKQEDMGEQTFEDFYSDKMEKLITHFKDKLI